MSGVTVRFRRVSKRFRMGESHDSLRDLAAGALRRLRGVRRESGPPRSFQAVVELDFQAERGEALGIIGQNGAGKSTVLKLLASILRPDQGEVFVKGRLTALIEIGAGFHGDLTGRENIFLNGAILGMTRREIRQKLDDVVSFAGVGRFLDTPVKRYSSGMSARLGFSIAAHVDPDVLLVDEVLSVGDAAFRLRCLERMRELIYRGTTLIFVSHQLDQVQAVCPRAIVMEGGRNAFDGSARDAVGHYLRAMSRSYVARTTDLREHESDQPRAVENVHLRFLDPAEQEVVSVRAKEPLQAVLTFRLNRFVNRMIVELNMRATTDENLLSLNSGREGVFLHGEPGEQRVTLSLPSLPVAGGQYFWNVRMWDADGGTTLLDSPFRVPMMIDDGGRATGILCVEHEWSCDRRASTDQDHSRAPRPQPGELRAGAPVEIEAAS